MLTKGTGKRCPGCGLLKPVANVTAVDWIRLQIKLHSLYYRGWKLTVPLQKSSCLKISSILSTILYFLCPILLSCTREVKNLSTCWYFFRPVSGLEYLALESVKNNGINAKISILLERMKCISKKSQKKATK